METVFSCGAAAFNGTEMEPEQFVLPDGKEFTALRNQEEAFLVQLQEEKTLEHQLRTEAVLNCLTRSSQMRLEFLRACIRDNRA